MKILLIYPYPLFDRSKSHEEDISVPPMGVYYVAALLKEHNYDVDVLNWSHIHRTPEKVIETFRRTRPRIVAFSILNANRWGGIELAQIAKAVDSTVRVVFGGVGASSLWKHLMKHFPVIDYLIMGEGEHAFLELARKIEAGKEETVKEVRGVAFREGQDIRRTADAPFIKDLDDIPIPAKYFTYHHVVSSRGCPGRCTFCGSPDFWGRKVRFRSPNNFVEELALLYHKGISFFYVSDDTFTVNKKRVVDICRGILDQGLKISWFAISRADCVDEEVLYWMRKAGCVQISYGIESGSERIRAVLGKPLKAAHIKKAFALTHKYGILARAYFIYGAPGESWETIGETIELLKTIRPFVIISYILEIYPGTKLYTDFLGRTGYTDDIWLQKMEGILHFETDPSLDKGDVLAFGKAIREALYANLSVFVDELDLVDDPELYPMHADFCSRLAMTFSHGDYSKTEGVKDPPVIAEKLYRHSLSFAPTERAYLGLGMLKQGDHDIRGAAQVLNEGLKLFPQSEGLNICLATNYMNESKFSEALDLLIPFGRSLQALRHVARCYRALGDHNNETRTCDKIRRLEKLG